MYRITHFVLGLTATFAMLGSRDAANGSNPVWVTRVDHECNFDPSGRFNGEGIAALSTHEVVMYCVTRNPTASPGLSKRGELQTSDPYRMNVLFLDAKDGHILQRTSWPTLAETQADIFPVNDKFFLLVAGNAIQLVDRTTLSTVHHLALADHGSGCERMKATASLNGLTFAISQVCKSPTGYMSHIAAYDSVELRRFADWTSEGRNFVDIFDQHLLRWSTDNSGYSNEIVLHTPGLADTILRGNAFIVSRSLFVDGDNVLCCKGTNWLRILRFDGQEMAHLSLDPNHSSSDPKIIADQIFVSKTGQHMGALIFHVPWAGIRSWECEVFDRRLHPLLRVTVPAYHYDVTALLSPDDNYAFVLRDATISAYSIPRSSAP